jgi:hypothetical protein
VLTGHRQVSFQVISCPACGAERFILPRSPFADIAEAPASGLARKSRAALWLLPVIAMLLTAAVLAAVWQLFLLPQRPRDSSAREKKTAVERLEQAGRYLGSGLFRLAADELKGEPDDLAASKKRRWRQVRREAALFADLSTEPLEEILQHAAGVPEREWQADFPHRYGGKAIIFDTVVQRTANGKLQALYVFPRADKVHLEIGDLALFRDLPLDKPRRVLFGARLALIGLEAPGPAWVIRFQPESGVFLTDAQAAGLCCPGLNEPDALRVLEEQSKL